MTMLFKQSGGEFLDVATCGSSVRWDIEVNHEKRDSIRVSTDVHLTDCDRRISWGGYGEDGLGVMIKKLNVAIHSLNAARAACVFAQRKIAADKKTRSKK